MMYCIFVSYENQREDLLFLLVIHCFLSTQQTTYHTVMIVSQCYSVTVLQCHSRSQGFLRHMQWEGLEVAGSHCDIFTPGDLSVMSSRQYKLAETINHICSSSFSCNFPQVFLLSRWYSHKSSSMIRSLLISSSSLS